MLADLTCIRQAVQEVSGHLSSYERVIAVVSAFKNQTDSLEQSAAELCQAPREDTLAFYMGLGELRSTAELTLGLQAGGIPATLLMPWDVSLVSDGPPLSATPVTVSRSAFAAAFENHPVVVFPGYVSRGHDGQPQVLGRGGSDLTAIFLAAELQADHCVLLKDTPGVFEWDPAREGPRPRRYSKIHWDDAFRVCGKILRPEHVEYARSRSVTIEITALGAGVSTAVGPEASEFDSSGQPLTPNRKPNP